MVTHDQAEALAICDKIAVMDQGRIVQHADPLTLYDAPSCKIVADFVGRSSQLPGSVINIAGDATSVHIPGCSAPVLARTGPNIRKGDSVFVALRPEKVRIEAHGSGTLEGKVTSRVFEGDSWLFVVETPVGMVLACELHRGLPTVAEGERVSLTWRMEDSVLLPSGGVNA